jgi:hypothetical protein
MKPKTKSEARWQEFYLGGAHTKRGYTAFAGSRRVCKRGRRKAERQGSKLQLNSED